MPPPSIISLLKSHANPKNVEGMARFGISSKNTLGVSIPFLRKLAGDTDYERAFFRWPLAKILKTNGFKNIAIKPFDWLHPFTPAPLTPSVEKIGNVLEKIPLIKEFSGSLLIYAENIK